MSCGTPPGHIPINRFISVPALLGDSLVGQIALANSDRDYTEDDLTFIKRLATLYAIAIQRNQAEEKLQKAHTELEQRVEERTAELLQANEQLQREIDVRMRTEEEIRKAEEKYRLLVQNLPSVVYKGYEDWSVEFFDEKVESLMGYSADDFHAKKLKWSDLIIEEDLENVREAFVEALKTDKSYVREYRTKTRAGDILWIQDRGQIICHEDGMVDYVSGAFFDVTDRKMAEEALRESEKELRLLSGQLLTTQEQERGRIARELHDGIGQSLSAIKFRLEDALGQMGKDVAEASVSALNGLIPIIQSTVEEVRRITMDLRPSTLDDLGILATIGWFCREFQETYATVRIKKEIGLEEADIPESLKTVIFRVLQEALNNVAKHSGADSVTVFLTKKDDTIELAIEDNGRGFDLKEVLDIDGSKRGFGLGSMKERIELSGGSFSLESIRRGGTNIRASWQG
jgi:PAS domain S-box-containing protein